MGFELLKEADMVLDACGRPSPPPGFRFVDLPRIINFVAVVPFGGVEGTAPGVSSQLRVTNNAKTLFICRGVGIRSSQLTFRIKWPSGRFFNQRPFASSAFAIPAGSAGTMLALNQEQPVEKGARIAVEQVGSFLGGSVALDFWGVLRYLIKEVNDGGEPPGNYCIVGYPASARGQKTATWKLQLMDDPVTVLESLPRYMCGPNQNIMAPEFLLGDSAADGETPTGRKDESFTFFSPQVTIPVGASVFETVVLVPGHDDLVLKRWRAITTWPDGTTGTPLVGMRLPNGYGVTGGDLLPMVYEWMPFFPSLPVAAGTRIILDFANMDSTGSSISTKIEFDCVKRTR